MGFRLTEVPPSPAATLSLAPILRSFHLKTPFSWHALRVPLPSAQPTKSYPCRKRCHTLRDSQGRSGRCRRCRSPHSWCNDPGPARCRRCRTWTGAVPVRGSSRTRYPACPLSAIRSTGEIARVVLPARAVIGRAEQQVGPRSRPRHGGVLHDRPGNRGGTRHAYPANKQTDYAKRYEDFLPHLFLLRFE